jgi:hypothetical protein
MVMMSQVTLMVSQVTVMVSQVTVMMSHDLKSRSSSDSRSLASMVSQIRVTALWIMVIAL